jgi:hypothetical protein
MGALASDGDAVFTGLAAIRRALARGCTGRDRGAAGAMIRTDAVPRAITFAPAHRTGMGVALPPSSRK